MLLYCLVITDMFLWDIQDVRRLLDESQEWRRKFDDIEEELSKTQMSKFHLCRGNILKAYVDKLLGSLEQRIEGGDRSNISNFATATRSARAASSAYEQRSELLKRFDSLDEACFKPLQEYEKVTSPIKKKIP